MPLNLKIYYHQKKIAFPGFFDTSNRVHNDFRMNNLNEKDRIFFFK